MTEGKAARRRAQRVLPGSVRMVEAEEAGLGSFLECWSWMALVVGVEGWRSRLAEDEVIEGSSGPVFQRMTLSSGLFVRLHCRCRKRVEDGCLALEKAKL